MLAIADRRIEENIAIAKHLDETDKARIPMDLFPYWKGLSSDERIGYVPPSASVSYRKGCFRIRWDWLNRDAERPSLDWITLQLIQKRVPLSVVGLVMPALGVSTSDAIRFRSLLSAVGNAITDEIGGAHQETRVRLLSATFDRGELIENMQQALDWSAEKISRCIDLFTLSEARSEVWYQPLIDVGGNKLAFALHPLCHASGVRTLEWLLSRDKKKEGKKGELYEQDVADYFAAAIRSNGVVETELRHRVKTRNDIGDIDLLIRFHDLLLVVECKCLSQPSTDNDFYNRENVIRHASKQAMTKAAYVIENVGGFMKRHGMSGLQVRTVIPLVMVSGNECVGLSYANDVQVVSKGSLGLVLANMAPTTTEIDRDGHERYLVGPAQQYSDVDGAISRLLAEIKAPTLIELNRPYLKSLAATYPVFADNRQKYEIDYFRVVFDEEDKRQFMTSMGMSPS
jgi:hypothetical protein